MKKKGRNINFVKKKSLEFKDREHKTHEMSKKNIITKS